MFTRSSIDKKKTKEKVKKRKKKRKNNPKENKFTRQSQRRNADRLWNIGTNLKSFLRMRDNLFFLSFPCPEKKPSRYDVTDSKGGFYCHS